MKHIGTVGHIVVSFMTMCPTVPMCFKKDYGVNKDYLFRKTNAFISDRRSQSVTAQQTNTTKARVNNKPPSPFTSTPKMKRCETRAPLITPSPPNAPSQAVRGMSKRTAQTSSATPLPMRPQGSSAELLENPDTFFCARKFEKEGLGKNCGGDKAKCYREIIADHIVLNFESPKVRTSNFSPKISTNNKPDLFGAATFGAITDLWH